MMRISTMTGRVLTYVALVIGLAGAQVAMAEAPALTQTSVSQFIDSLTEVGEVADQYEEELPVEDLESIGRDPSRITSPFSSSMQAMQSHAAFGEISQIVQDHGFADVAAWAATGDRVFRAVGALELDASGAGISAEIAKAIEELEASGLPEAQKQQMLQMMNISSASIKAFSDVSQADRDAVAPFVETLKNMR